MIKIKKVLKKNPREPEAAPRYYASAVHDVKVDLNSLATSVADRCSLRRADVHGVLIALMDIIPAELASGKIISLGDLGSFYINVQSEGTETEAELIPRMVKGTNIRYRPTKELRKKMRMIDVSFAN